MIPGRSASGRYRDAHAASRPRQGQPRDQPRTTQLIYRERRDHWIVVASNGGADWEPGWWPNLRAGSSGSVEVGGRSVPIHGTEVTGPEREDLWRELNDRVFDFDSYQAKVSRRIAVVGLAPAT